MPGPEGRNEPLPGAGIYKEELSMIMLTKTSGERFLVNHLQIECIELIPETKIVMMNRHFYLVLESVQDITARIADYNAKVMDIHRTVTVNENPQSGAPAARSSTQRPGYRR